MRGVVLPVTIIVTLSFLPLSAGAVDPDVKCELKKLDTAVTYETCRFRVESKHLRRGKPLDFTKCDDKFSKNWHKAEEKWGQDCLTSGDGVAIQDEIADHTESIAMSLSGVTTTTTTTSSSTTSTTLRFVDNGNGTVTDNQTGLMWEKKSDDDSIHDKDNTYNWHQALSVHAAGLNTMSFAGHDDWRVPDVKELYSIIDYGYALPAADPAFNNGCTPGCTVINCSCTQGARYWSFTLATPVDVYDAWQVFFHNGGVDHADKSNPIGVRAVRGGG